MLGGRAFVVCWRCTAITAAMFVRFQNHHLWLDPIFLILAFLLLLPCAVDGIRQYVLGIESTNTKRILTGLLAGYGSVWFLDILFSYQAILTTWLYALS